MDEVAVGAHGEDLHAEHLKLVILVGKILKLGGADEREVGGIEEEHCPLALNVFVGDCLEVALLECLNGELGCVLIDNCLHSWLNFVIDEYVICLWNDLSYHVLVLLTLQR